MKKDILQAFALLLVLISFCFTDCMTAPPMKQPPVIEKKLATDEYSNDTYGTEITEYTYDGCQYVKFSSGDMAWGAHKGNCNNPIHRQQTGIREARYSPRFKITQ